MEKKVLVLTSWFFPHQILRWEDAVTLIYQDKADVVAHYDDEIRSSSVTWQYPAVVRLRKDVRKRRNGVKFSRFNVFTRDGFCCQYCGVPGKMSELTYDHVRPRSRGGKTNWENIVTACKSCNSAKGRMTCDESGVFPRKEPIRPKFLPPVPAVRDLDRAPEEWHAFLLPFLPASNQPVPT